MITGTLAGGWFHRGYSVGLIQDTRDATPYRLDAMRVLIAEDERELAELIAEGLRRRGFGADVAFDGRGALEKLATTSYDLLVLDRDLPLVSGDDVCRQVALRPMRPATLMLTAYGEVNDRVAGLRMGADDYLVKPFAFDELVARLQALARRSVRSAAPPRLRHRDLELEPAELRARRAGRVIELTPKEAGVLRMLLLAEGRVVSAETLLEAVWDDNADPFTTVVKVTVHRLRRRLGPPHAIETVAGSGYRLVA